MSGRITWEWVSPVDGSTTLLTEFANDIEVLKGIAGHGAPPLELIREQVPGMPGARTRSHRHGIGEITLPLVVRGSSFDDLENKCRDLVRRLDGLQGDGILRRTSLSGRVSDLVCTVTQGLRMDQANQLGTNAIKVPDLTFQADSPYWLGETQPMSFSGSAGMNWFPMGPWPMLGSSSILGNLEVTTASDVETYPVWTIVGPASDPIFTNTTTGQTFSLILGLTAGQTVTIDTTDFQKKVIGPDGSNWFSTLVERDLWALQPGLNQLSITVGDTTNASYVTGYYRDRTLMP